MSISEWSCLGLGLGEDLLLLWAGLKKSEGKNTASQKKKLHSFICSWAVQVSSRISWKRSDSCSWFRVPHSSITTSIRHKWFTTKMPDLLLWTLYVAQFLGLVNVFLLKSDLYHVYCMHYLCIAPAKCDIEHCNPFPSLYFWSAYMNHLFCAVSDKHMMTRLNSHVDLNLRTIFIIGVWPSAEASPQRWMRDVNKWQNMLWQIRNADCSAITARWLHTKTFFLLWELFFSLVFTWPGIQTHPFIVGPGEPLTPRPTIAHHPPPPSLPCPLYRHLYQRLSVICGQMKERMWSWRKKIRKRGKKM